MLCRRASWISAFRVAESHPGRATTPLRPDDGDMTRFLDVPT